MIIQTVPLSGLTNFADLLIGVGAIESGTIIHTATNIPGEHDWLSLYVMNDTEEQAILTLGIPLLSMNTLFTLPAPTHPDPGSPLVLKDYRMTNGMILRAVASQADTVTVNGFVYRQAAAGSSANHVPSSPPAGAFSVTNLYVDPATGKLVTEYDDTPTP